MQLLQNQKNENANNNIFMKNTSKNVHIIFYDSCRDIVPMVYFQRIRILGKDSTYSSDTSERENFMLRTFILVIA